MNGLSDAVRFVALAAREIADGDVCFVGIGVPSLAAIAAKRRHAPHAVLIYESGAVDADPPVPPLSTGSPSVVADTAMVTSCLGVFSMLQQGRFDLGPAVGRPGRSLRQPQQHRARPLRRPPRCASSAPAARTTSPRSPAPPSS